MTPQLNICPPLPCSAPWDGLQKLSALLPSMTSGRLWKTMSRWEAEENYQETYFSLLGASRCSSLLFDNPPHSSFLRLDFPSWLLQEALLETAVTEKSHAALHRRSTFQCLYGGWIMPGPSCQGLYHLCVPSFQVPSWRQPKPS